MRAAGDPGPAGGQGAWPRTPCTQTSAASVNVSTQLGLGQDARGSGCEFGGQDLVGISEHSSSVVLLLASWAPGRQGWRPHSPCSCAPRPCSCPEPGHVGVDQQPLLPVAAETSQHSLCLASPCRLPRWNVACARVTGTLPGFLTYLLTCVFCYFFLFSPFPIFFLALIRNFFAN